MKRASLLLWSTILLSPMAGVAAAPGGLALLTGTWTGPAQWKFEMDDLQTQATLALELTIGADGAITGSGNGCAFTGMLAAGDAMHSLHGSTVTAAGCADAEFNGTYMRVRLERFGPAALVVRMRKGDDESEASISARLANAAGPTPPAQPGVGSIAGDWVGTVAWEAEVQGQAHVEANKELSLSISPSGAVSGSGFGCTFTGMLAGNPASRSGFSGPMTAAGCDNPLFNGDFNQVRVRVQRAGTRLEVHLQREAAGAEVGIEGRLDAKAAAASPPPVPPVSAPLAGAWHGNVMWTASSRGASGVSVTSTIEAIMFSIANDGTFAGSGFGCTFAGKLVIASDGRSVSGGDITASGCTNAAFNGKYASPQFHRDDGALEIELEREDRTAGGEVKAKIAGKVARA